MIGRLRRLLGGDKREADSARATYPLCRLRHATLHPGALLWTPGSGGGNLGLGAAAALDEVGEGGEVVVAFQTRAREPVHPHGVLARVEAVSPFPEGWDPTGLGATRRYRLRGLRRVELDVHSFTHRRVPSVAVSDSPSRPADWVAAPDDLVALLDGLARADSSWPEHWQEAFETLPTATLGQWATTLGWRLGAEDRLALFDGPDHIVDAVRSALDSVQIGLDPTRRRAAVRRQMVTRRTSSMPERSVDFTADEDGWALFHPGDLAGEDAAPDSASAGLEARMAAHLARGDAVMILTTPFCTGRLRLTPGPLSAEEAERRLGEAVFRLDVRHGRLFVGRGGLVTGNHFDDKLDYADAAQWVDIPSGCYRVTVTALEGGLEAAPEVEAAPEAASEAAPVAGPPASPEELCRRYVVRFEPVKTLDEVPTLQARPRL